MWYLFWTIFAFITTALSAYISKKANDTQLWFWVYMGFLMGPTGIWPFVAKYSKDLVFDAFLYDTIILFAFFTTLWYLGVERFGPWQIIASIMIIIGLVLFKIHA